MELVGLSPKKKKMREKTKKCNGGGSQTSKGKGARKVCSRTPWGKS